MRIKIILFLFLAIMILPVLSIFSDEERDYQVSEILLYFDPFEVKDSTEFESRRSLLISQLKERLLNLGIEKTQIKSEQTSILRIRFESAKLSEEHIEAVIQKGDLLVHFADNAAKKYQTKAEKFLQDYMQIAEEPEKKQRMLSIKKAISLPDDYTIFYRTKIDDETGYESGEFIVARKNADFSGVDVQSSFIENSEDEEPVCKMKFYLSNTVGERINSAIRQNISDAIIVLDDTVITQLKLSTYDNKTGFMFSFSEVNTTCPDLQRIVKQKPLETLLFIVKYQ